MSRCRRVVLFVETWTAVGRGILHGVAEYSRLYGPWIFHVAGDHNQFSAGFQERCDGIIAQIKTKRIAQSLSQLNIPMVAIAGAICHRADAWQGAKGVLASANDEEIAALAVDHLLASGLENFAFVGRTHDGSSQRRLEAFANGAAKDYGLFVYCSGKNAYMRWDLEQQFMTKWISTLPLPIGIVACDDERGRQVIEACSQAGLRVPQDAAVVGVNNDDLICQLSNPALSSVALNSIKAGFEMAKALDHLMDGRSCVPRRITIEATGVVRRQSTDSIAVNDYQLAEALNLIRLARGKTVEAITLASGLPRYELERRFRTKLGHSIYREIQIARLNRAKHLLNDPKLSVMDCARLAGFKSARAFDRLFTKRVGITPRCYRKNLCFTLRPDTVFKDARHAFRRQIAD
jgi:LacI family transcriptional regulator